MFVLSCSSCHLVRSSPACLPPLPLSFGAALPHHCYPPAPPLTPPPFPRQRRPAAPAAPAQRLLHGHPLLQQRHLPLSSSMLSMPSVAAAAAGACDPLLLRYLLPPPPRLPPSPLLLPPGLGFGIEKFVWGQQGKPLLLKPPQSPQSSQLWFLKFSISAGGASGARPLLPWTRRPADDATWQGGAMRGAVLCVQREELRGRLVGDACSLRGSQAEPRGASRGHGQGGSSAAGARQGCDRGKAALLLGHLVGGRGKVALLRGRLGEQARERAEGV